MITVFYDSQCGLCSREINHYRKVAPEGVFDWQDISGAVDQLAEEGISQVDALKILHAKDANGKFHLGLDAFILIWQQLRRWRVLSVLVSLPPLKNIAQYFYIKFADWRFKRLPHCQLAQQNEAVDLSGRLNKQK